MSKKRGISYFERNDDEDDEGDEDDEEEEAVVNQQLKVLEAVRSGHSSDEEQEVKFQVALKGKLRLVKQLNVVLRKDQFKKGSNPSA